MTPDSPAELSKPVPAPQESTANPPIRLARLRQEFAELYAGLDAGTTPRGPPGSPAHPPMSGARRPPAEPSRSHGARIHPERPRRSPSPNSTSWSPSSASREHGWHGGCSAPAVAVRRPAP